MAEFTYAYLDESQLKAMLKHYLYTDLRLTIIGSGNVPNEYHAVMAHLRELDSE